MKDKFVGVVVTIISSTLMFLVYNYFNSFQSIAGSNRKFYEVRSEMTIMHSEINTKLDDLICFHDGSRCRIRDKNN